jgi:hypothetical protein
MTIRDVRVLAENLLASGDSDSARHAYAQEHDRYFTASLTVEDWLFKDVLRSKPCGPNCARVGLADAICRSRSNA